MLSLILDFLDHAADYIQASDGEIDFQTECIFSRLYKNLFDEATIENLETIVRSLWFYMWKNILHQTITTPAMTITEDDIS